MLTQKQQGKPKIQTWGKMKQMSQFKFLPVNYAHTTINEAYQFTLKVETKLSSSIYPISNQL